ncbi:MAG: hypothetical protein ACXAC5_02275 [Promethearchaeota archaeon]
MRTYRASVGRVLLQRGTTDSRDGASQYQDSRGTSRGLGLLRSHGSYRAWRRSLRRGRFPARIRGEPDQHREPDALSAFTTAVKESEMGSPRTTRQ